MLSAAWVVVPCVVAAWVVACVVAAWVIVIAAWVVVSCVVVAGFVVSCVVATWVVVYVVGAAWVVGITSTRNRIIVIALIIILCGYILTNIYILNHSDTISIGYLTAKATSISLWWNSMTIQTYDSYKPISEEVVSGRVSSFLSCVTRDFTPIRVIPVTVSYSIWIVCRSTTVTFVGVADHSTKIYTNITGKDIAIIGNNLIIE